MLTCIARVDSAESTNMGQTRRLRHIEAGKELLWLSYVQGYAKPQVYGICRGRGLQSRQGVTPSLVAMSLTPLGRHQHFVKPRAYWACLWPGWLAWCKNVSLSPWVSKHIRSHIQKFIWEMLRCSLDSTVSNPDLWRPTPPLGQTRSHNAPRWQSQHPLQVSLAPALQQCHFFITYSDNFCDG